MDYSALIEALRWKQKITPLEKDILDTANELQKVPFDMNSAENQTISNDLKYPWIFVAVAMMPDTAQKTRDQITETDLRYILSMQLSCLIEKEREATTNGQ